MTDHTLVPQEDVSQQQVTEQTKNTITLNVHGVRVHRRVRRPELVYPSAAKEIVDGKPLVYTCPYCLTTDVPVSEGFQPMNCHFICYGCYNGYFKALLNDGQFEVPCLFSQEAEHQPIKCTNKLVDAEIISLCAKFDNTPEQAVALMDQWTTNKHRHDYKDMLICPKCSQPSPFPSEPLSAEYECVNANCKTQFCIYHQLAHVGVSCEKFQNERKTEDELKRTNSFLNKMSKLCPYCKAHVEKDGGCNHISCKCGKHWCWICNGKIEVMNNERAGQAALRHYARGACTGLQFANNQFFAEQHQEFMADQQEQRANEWYNGFMQRNDVNVEAVQEWMVARREQQRPANAVNEERLRLERIENQLLIEAFYAARDQELFLNTFMRISHKFLHENIFLDAPPRREFMVRQRDLLMTSHSCRRMCLEALWCVMVDIWLILIFVCFQWIFGLLAGPIVCVASRYNGRQHTWFRDTRRAAWYCSLAVLFVPIAINVCVLFLIAQLVCVQRQLAMLWQERLLWLVSFTICCPCATCCWVICSSL